jgi:pimeloyl-ACP methyl ester carboxylesterase
VGRWGGVLDGSDCTPTPELAEVALEPLLQQIECPCLLLAGRLRPPDQVKRYAGLFRRAELAVTDSGHIMVVQAPAAVADAVRVFFLKR